MRPFFIMLFPNCANSPCRLLTNTPPCLNLRAEVSAGHSARTSAVRQVRQSPVRRTPRRSAGPPPPWAGRLLCAFCLADIGGRAPTRTHAASASLARRFVVRGAAWLKKREGSWGEVPARKAATSPAMHRAPGGIEAFAFTPHLRRRPIGAPLDTSSGLTPKSPASPSTRSAVFALHRPHLLKIEFREQSAD